MTDYKVGDRPWYARFQPVTDVWVACPICFGKRQVTLILGNDDQVTLPCGYCAPGYDPPTGRVREYQAVAAAERVIITLVTITENDAGQQRRYQATGRCYDGEDLFDTEEEANARAQEKAGAWLSEQETREDYIKKSVRAKFSWNAGYWMGQAKKARADAEGYDRKAVLCKARAKEPGDA